MALPSSAMYTALCVLPTCLGFWKSEYGVSYAYGVSLALVASHALFIGEPLTSTVAVAHATLLLCYGVRLCLFLLYRELTIPYFREFKEKIEERAKARGSRLSRTPFVLGCSFLYAGLAAPMILTASADPSPITCYLLGVAFVGWALAAVGDAQKTIFKARLGEGTLVTNGLFAFLRHPNYTGEMLMWTANLLAGALNVARPSALALLPSRASLLTLALLGWAGITFVLMQAGRNLQARQEARYTGVVEYEEWKAASWGGITLPPKKTVDQAPADSPKGPADEQATSS
ncbi:hypothetical protein CYMTET_9526 [Cymbomonas tetramitiformis]|uniref:Steroid 5-alpha reductase C-terminal domain-containing protein n=1 Tax=Cymbomonas tetramitiformis TaxID=36881 RepID=A0AAE0GRH2_9CHLO|nr:hypothetical protein CYMTET_9526 [Cymbomonas tetramitiformis]